MKLLCRDEYTLRRKFNLMPTSIGWLQLFILEGYDKGIIRSLDKKACGSIIISWKHCEIQNERTKLFQNHPKTYMIQLMKVRQLAISKHYMSFSVQLMQANLGWFSHVKRTKMVGYFSSCICGYSWRVSIQVSTINIEIWRSQNTWKWDHN